MCIIYLYNMCCFYICICMLYMYIIYLCCICVLYMYICMYIYVVYVSIGNASILSPPTKRPDMPNFNQSVVLRVIQQCSPRHMLLEVLFRHDL